MLKLQIFNKYFNNYLKSPIALIKFSFKRFLPTMGKMKNSDTLYLIHLVYQVLIYVKTRSLANYLFKIRTLK